MLHDKTQFDSLSNIPVFHGFNFVGPSRGSRISPMDQAGRLGLQIFNNTFNGGFGDFQFAQPSGKRNVFPMDRLGLQRFGNDPTFGAHRQDLNFLDRKGLFGLDVVDRVGQSKSEKNYNHLFMFYGVLIIL